MRKGFLYGNVLCPLWGTSCWKQSVSPISQPLRLPLPPVVCISDVPALVVGSSDKTELYVCVPVCVDICMLVHKCAFVEIITLPCLPSYYSCRQLPVLVREGERNFQMPKVRRFLFQNLLSYRVCVPSSFLFKPLVGNIIRQHGIKSCKNADDNLNTGQTADQ